jgi:hypothetical protein
MPMPCALRSPATADKSSISLVLGYALGESFDQGSHRCAARAKHPATSGDVDVLPVPALGWLICIVENDSQAVTLAGTYGAHAVTKVGSVVAACAANRSMMNCKDDRIPLFGSEHFNARLPARLLLGEDKLATVKIFAVLT